MEDIIKNNKIMGRSHTEVLDESTKGIAVGSDEDPLAGADLRNDGVVP